MTRMDIGVDAPRAAIVAIDCHRGHLDPEVATMPVAAEAAERVIAANKRLKRLDREIADRPWIAGEAFTIADITAYCGLRFFRIAGFEAGDETPNLKAWYERVTERPGASKTTLR